MRQEMIKRTYHGGFMNHIIFDNNCMVKKHVKNDPDFNNVGLAVNIFHFENKHADSDEFCHAHCASAKCPVVLWQLLLRMWELWITLLWVGQLFQLLLTTFTFGMQLLLWVISLQGDVPLILKYKMKAVIDGWFCKSIIRTPWVAQLQALPRKQEISALLCPSPSSFPLFFPSDGHPLPLPAQRRLWCPATILHDLVSWSTIWSLCRQSYRKETE